MNLAFSRCVMSAVDSVAFMSWNNPNPLLYESDDDLINKIRYCQGTFDVKYKQH
jgi:hypothetical protein